MRFPKIQLLAVALLFFTASSASAFNLTLATNPGSADTGNLSPGDEIIIDLYLDADPGLGFLGVAILFEDDGDVAYDNVNAATTMPSYILYTGGKGATYMIPNANPPIYWNGVNTPDRVSVLVEYLEQALGSATATGTNIWIATLVFDVNDTANMPSTMEMTLSGNGTIVEAYAVDVKGSTTITDGVLNLPEPSAALLAVAALSTVFAVRSSRRRS